MPIRSTSVSTKKKGGINKAALVLKRGGVVVFPTDTVYGVGALLSSKKGLTKFYKVKRRSKTKPSQVLVSSFDEVLDMVVDIPNVALHLIEKFWPGPLTLIFKASKRVPKPVQGKGGTVAIRMPDHEVPTMLIKKAGPLVASSANSSGKKTPKKFEELDPKFMKQADVVIKGEVTLGAASTIVDVTGPKAKVLRMFEHKK